MHQAHIFLGPSLDLKTASTLVPTAHVHPPIQCGDIIRLLRLNPSLIVIIDGLYETTPAVWHKEILLAMEMGIEVWGAASMGALRAAELHHYGMHGFGAIFQDFKEGVLEDDDEVAVLHLGQDEHFTPINDAMVNIRATCEKAWRESVLTEDTKNKIVAYCKTQFYPYRSLTKAIRHLSQSDAKPYLIFSQWLEKNGVIDLKKNDAIAALELIQSRGIIAAKKPLPSSQSKSMTCFLRELILFANTTPFRHNAAWLPEVEQQIYALHQHDPMTYMLLAEVVSFVQKLVVFSSDEKRTLDNTALLHYIEENKLYSPTQDFSVYKDHAVLSDVYSLICQTICLHHLTTHQLNAQMTALAHYYDLPENVATGSTKLLRIILVLLLSINQHMKQTNLVIAERYLTHHLKQIKNWRRYDKTQFKNWLTNTPVSRAEFISLLKTYLMATSVHALNTVKIEYYQWIYDVHAMLCD